MNDKVIITPDGVSKGRVHRRTILTGSAAALGALALAGCTTAQTSTAASDAQLIADGISAMVPSLTAAGVSATVLAQVQTYATQAVAAANAIAATVSPSTVQQIVTIVGTVAQVVLPLVPGASAIATVIAAAQALLPGLLAAAGVTGAAPTVPAMPPAAARLILRAY